jgi:hypothetical protein
MTSQFLDQPLRSLRDIHAETEAAVRDLEQRQEGLCLLKTEADLELRFEAADELGERIDAIGDRLGALLDRLDTLEEEIAFRNQPGFTGGAP